MFILLHIRLSVSLNILLYLHSSKYQYFAIFPVRTSFDISAYSSIHMCSIFPPGKSYLRLCLKTCMSVLSRTHRGFLGGTVAKNPPANTRHAGDAASAPGSGRSPGAGIVSLLQHSCLENSTGRGAWWATVPQGCRERDQLSDGVCTHTRAFYPLFCPSVQFSSVAQSCPTLCSPMNRSTPGLPVHHHLPEFTQTHVHRVRDAIQPSHPLFSPSPPAPNPSQHQNLFQ